MIESFNSFFSKDKVALLFLLTFSCALASILRLSEFWDFYNYHYYNAWAFLNNRLNVDVVPAFGNTYFSPFADIPLYFLANALNHHPVIFSVILAVPFGLNLFLIYKISTLFFSKDETAGRIRIIMILLLYLCSTNLLPQISSTFNDMPPTVLILASFYLILKDIFVERKFFKRTYLIAGFSIGVAAGLKLTFASYAVASGLTVFLFFKKLNHPVKTIFLFGSAMFAGFLISYGYWGWILWKNYQNPFFPFFNNIFHSPFWEGQIEDYQDHRYFHLSALKVFLFPFLLFYNYKGTFPLELHIGLIFSNLRYCLAYITFFWILISSFKRPRPTASKQTFLFVWLVLIYIVWLIVFRVERYLTPFEIVLNLALIDYFFPLGKPVFKNVRGGIFVLFIIAVISEMPFYAIWRRPYSYPLLPEAIPLPENSLIVLYGPPTAAFIPFLATDNSTIAVINPLHDKAINGSDFYTRGYFAKKSQELLMSWLDDPQKDIYFLDAYYSHGLRYTKDGEGNPRFFENGLLPCHPFFSIHIENNEHWNFHLCRQSSKNFKSNDDFFRYFFLKKDKNL